MYSQLDNTATQQNKAQGGRLSLLTKSLIHPDDDYPKTCFPPHIFSFPLSQAFKCPMSHSGGILNDPITDSCGHTYCSGCIQKNIRDGELFICPSSKKRLSIHSDLRRNNIMGLCLEEAWVNCINHDKGCNWRGNLPELPNHIRLHDCKYARYKCINNGCGEYIPLKSYSMHVKNECDYRSDICRFCNKNIGKDELQVHLKKCFNIEEKTRSIVQLINEVAENEEQEGPALSRNHSMNNNDRWSSSSSSSTTSLDISSSSPIISARSLGVNAITTTTAIITTTEKKAMNLMMRNDNADVSSAVAKKLELSAQ